MNKLSESIKPYFNINKTKNENYSFRIAGKQVLCLNQRVMEIGVGACFVYSASNIFNKTIEINLKENLYITTGLVTTAAVGGFQGLAFLLLTSHLFNVSNEPNLFLNLRSFNGISFFVGQGVVLTGSMCLILVSLSLLIKKYGCESIKTLLNSFNRTQNTINHGIFDVKNNLEYKLSILGQDILCLKKIVLQIGSVLGFIAAFLIEASFEGRIEGILGILIHAAGLLTVYKALGNKIYIILPALVGSLSIFNPSNYSTYWSACEFIISTIGEGMLLMGACLGAFALLSSLARKSGNKQITKLGQLINNLKDKQKVTEYNRYIKDLKLSIDERQKRIDDHNNKFINTEMATLPNNAKMGRVQKGKDKNHVPFVDDQSKGKGKEKVKTTAPKPVVEIEHTYTTTLKGDNKTTWEDLFEITTSLPANGKIEDAAIKKLITSLGGQVKSGSKNKWDIYFQGQCLNSYEVIHENGGLKGKLRSKHANRVKKAIIKAINLNLVKPGVVTVLPA